mgnify:CR=1 FL=1
MSTMKEILHKKREVTEKHIKQLQQAGKQDVRYTAMMPDIPFLVLGLFSDVGLGEFLNFAFGLPNYTFLLKKEFFNGVKSLLIYQSFGSADVIDKAHHFVEFEIMCFSVSRVMNSKSIKISLIFEHPLQELHQLYSEVYSNCRHC